MVEKPVDALTQAQARNELSRLAQALAAANRAYHTLDAPEMSDADYDVLKRRNAAIEARFPGLKRADSPSDVVGGPIAEGFAKVRHGLPLLSLENIFSDEEVFEFYNSVKAFLGMGASTEVEFLADPKIDGLSVKADGCSTQRHGAIAGWAKTLRRMRKPLKRFQSISPQISTF